MNGEFGLPTDRGRRKPPEWNGFQDVETSEPKGKLMLVLISTGVGNKKGVCLPSCHTPSRRMHTVESLAHAPAAWGRLSKRRGQNVAS